MEALQKLYSLVHPNIQKDIDYYIRHNGRISEHNYEFCDKHTFNDCYFSKIFVFSKQSVFNKKMDEYNKSPNIYLDEGLRIFNATLCNHDKGHIASTNIGVYAKQFKKDGEKDKMLRNINSINEDEHGQVLQDVHSRQNLFRRFGSGRHYCVI